MSKIYTVHELIKMLVGNIEPYGDSSVDCLRLDNLKEHCDTSLRLIEDLIDTAKYRDRPEQSIKIMGEHAYNVLVDIKEILNNAL